MFRFLSHLFCFSFQKIWKSFLGARGGRSYPPMRAGRAGRFMFAGRAASWDIRPTIIA
jgi:hypothetical protein